MKHSTKHTLMTGGSGLLGGEMQRIAPDLICPGSGEFNVADFPSMLAYVEQLDAKPAQILHAAAFTKTHEAPAKPAEAMDVNIIGTCNVAKLCHQLGMRLVYISTDYVFRGDKGNYAEDDEVLPSNVYAWSKLGGECAARMIPGSLIVRTSFGPEPFPFDKAFDDLWTSKIRVSELARRLLPVVESDLTGVLHIGSERRTILDYAVSISNGKQIQAAKSSESNLTFPGDTSLDCSKYRRIFGDFS